MSKKATFLIVFLCGLSVALFAGGQQSDSGTTESAAMMTTGEYSEAPELAEMVAAGTLPPVADRLPEEPMVIQPNREIGEYGGRIVHRGGLYPYYEKYNLILNRPADDTIPHIVKEWEFNDDGTEFTMYLRKGMRWSNGDYVTADDYLFQYYDVDLNTEINANTPGWAVVAGETVEMEKIDDYTVKLSFAVPFYGVLNKMNLVGRRKYWGPAPSEWLAEYHIKYNDKANDVAKAAGFDHWWQYFRQVYDLDNATTNYTGEKLGRPELSAWIFKDETATAYTYERNPYYWKVDTAGNQLPYIDSIIGMKVEDRDVNLLKVLNGEMDIGGWGLGVSDFPTLKKNEAQGNYRAWVAEDLWGSATVFCIQQTYRGPDADVMAPLLANVKFRQALSVAMNRGEIVELVGLGQGTARQATVHPKTPGFKQEWADTYTQHDPELANQLLDELGLSNRNSEGWRTDANGNVIALDIPISTSHTYWIEMTELVRNHWQAVGIKTNVRTIANSALFSSWSASEIMVFVWAFDRVYGQAFVESSGSWLNPSFWNGPVSPLWRNWLVSDGEGGEEPPELIKELYEVCKDISYSSPEKQIEITQIIGDAYAENLWLLGTVGMIGKPVVIKNGLGNVRDNFYPENISVPGNQWYFQYFWKDEGRRNQ